MVADLAGFGSFWALGDCNQPNWARGTISWCRLKLQHQPWALWTSGQGTVRRLPMLGLGLGLGVERGEKEDSFSPLNDG